MTDQAVAAPERLDYEQARALFERNFGLVNAHDIEGLAQVVTEDVVFEDDAWPEPVRGREEFRRFQRALATAMPDIRFELIEGPYLAEEGRRAAVRVRVTGTGTGRFDPPGFAPTGQPVELEYGGFYEFEGDLVKRARIIINMHEVGIQAGAFPPRGSLGEQVGVRMQNLNAWRMRRKAGRA